MFVFVSHCALTIKHVQFAPGKYMASSLQVWYIVPLGLDEHNLQLMDACSAGVLEEKKLSYRDQATIDCKRRLAKIYITSLFGTNHMKLQAKYNAPYFSFTIKQVQRTNSNVKLGLRRTSLILTIVHSIKSPMTGPKLPKNPFIVFSIIKNLK